MEKYEDGRVGIHVAKYIPDEFPPTSYSLVPVTNAATALYHPDHTRSPVVDGSYDSLKMGVAGRSKKAHGTSLV